MEISKKAKLNFYRKKKYSDGVLLTTDYGTWLYLPNKEYKHLLSGEIDDKLFSLLEEKGILVTDANKDVLAKRYLYYQDPVFSGTSLHIIVPTIRCNQTCVYCYALRKPLSTKGVDMDEKTAKATVDFIFKSPSRGIMIEFTGGEPLLNFPIIKFIIKYSGELNKKRARGKKKDIEYSLVTNGTLLNEEIVDFLIANNVGVCISLDGPKELHDSQRKYSDNSSSTYDKVEYWIKVLKERTTNTNAKLNALPVTTKSTVKYWKETVDTFVGFGFATLRLKYMACFGFAKETWEKIGYTSQEYLFFWKNAVNYMLELNKKGIMIRDGMATILLTKLLKEENPRFSEMNAPCGSVTGQMVYNYNGDIYPCDESRIFPEFKIGNVMENPYREVVSHPTACSLISVSSNLSLLCDNCPYFAFCGLCPLQSYSMSGSLITKLPFDIKCKMHKAMLDFLFEKILFNPKERKMLEAWLDYRESP